MQYTRRDWRNRNKIKTPEGLRWLTIPVKAKGNYNQKIKDVVISNTEWNIKHWKSIVHNYAKAPYFALYKDHFEQLYLDQHEISLSRINYRFISAICTLLNINTKISWSMDYDLKGDRSERLANLCIQTKSCHYIAGPGSKAYLDEGLFKNKRIELSYIEYSGYPEYSQLYPSFDHRTSIIDLIFNEGPNSSKYMNSF